MEHLPPPPYSESPQEVTPSSPPLNDEQPIFMIQVPPVAPHSLRDCESQKPGSLSQQQNLSAVPIPRESTRINLQRENTSTEQQNAEVDPKKLIQFVCLIMLLIFIVQNAMIIILSLIL